MVRTASPFALIALLLLAGCTGTEEEFGTPGSGGGGGGDDDTDVTDDTASDDTGELPTDDDTPYFEDPGDSVDFKDDDGDAEVDLTDQSESDAGSNQDQEFYVVLVNTGSSELGYQLRYDVPTPADTGDAGDGSGGSEGGPEGARPRRASAPAQRGPSEFRTNLRQAKAAGRLGTAKPEGRRSRHSTHPTWGPRARSSGSAIP